jgi:uncharacterized protein YebE (UPF0316 family)
MMYSDSFYEPFSGTWTNAPDPNSGTLADGKYTMSAGSSLAWNCGRAFANPRPEGNKISSGIVTAEATLNFATDDIEIGKAMMIVDGVIIALSAVVFSDVEAALFGVVALFCQTRIVNQIVYGSEKGRNILVISEKTEEIAQRILLEKNRGATFLNAQGAYSKKTSKVLMCVVRVWEYHEIKEIIYEEDPKAFVIASEAEHIMGEGFSSIKGM